MGLVEHHSVVCDLCFVAGWQQSHEGIVVRLSARLKEGAHVLDILLKELQLLNYGTLVKSHIGDGLQLDLLDHLSRSTFKQLHMKCSHLDCLTEVVVDDCRDWIIHSGAVQVVGKTHRQCIVNQLRERS